jgi:hypothetical protein
MRIISTGAAAMRHSAIAVTEALIVAAIVAALLLALAPVYQPADFLAGTESAQAAKGGNGGGKGSGKGGGGNTTGTGTIALALLDGGDAVANYRERAAFDVSTTATDRPFVGLRCWQGANWVLDGYVGYFDDYMFDPWITLGSPYWQADLAANCTARLFWYDSRGNQNVVATLDFAVAP